jgi:hypothetical protein
VRQKITEYIYISRAGTSPASGGDWRAAGGHGAPAVLDEMPRGKGKGQFGMLAEMAH